MEIKQILKAIFVLFLINSCSSDPNRYKSSEVLKHYFDQSKPKIIKVFKSEEISKIKYPVIEVRTNGVLIQGLMLPISERNGYSHYISGSGQALTVRGSIITKTNGINVNLISLELEETSPLSKKIPINNWPLENIHIYSFLDAQSNIKKIKVNCRFNNKGAEKIKILEKNFDVNKVIQTCKNKNLSFSNLFWADDNGFIWKSKQWISNDNIFAEIKVLKK
ncbi:MAG: hypothetical protein CMP38_02775 [Rickettsiales bacterium]|nr:hypothetical protein [Rickettsiales bacterium]